MHGIYFCYKGKSTVTLGMICDHKDSKYFKAESLVLYKI